MGRRGTAAVVAEPEPAGEPEPRRRRRRWVTVVLALLALPVLGVAVLRLGGIELEHRVPLAALAITPYVAAYGVLVALLSLLARRRVLAIVALVLGLSLGAILVPRYLADGDDLPEGQHLKVMSVNLYVGTADPGTVVELVRNSDTDVLVLQELTPAAVVALDRAGLSDLLPSRVLLPQPGGGGSGIMARVPLRQIVLVQGTPFEQPAAVVDLSGSQDVEIVSVHALPPMVTEGPRQWRADLAKLPPPDPKGRMRVLAGDFNATLDHAAFSKLLIDRGYADAAELAGEGLRPTWSSPPYGPPVTIDHVLVDGRIGVAGFAVYDVPGSDHNAIWAELVLPR